MLVHDGLFFCSGRLCAKQSDCGKFASDTMSPANFSRLGVMFSGAKNQLREADQCSLPTKLMTS